MTNSKLMPNRVLVARLVVLMGVAAAAMSCGSGQIPEETRSVARSTTALALGTTQTFAVLAGSTVTNTGSTVVTGDLGLSPGSAVTGFPPGLVNGGAIHTADAVALQAHDALTTAYNELAGQACNGKLTGQDLGGLTLTPGTYCFSSSAQLTGTLTLNAQGDPAAVFVFQIGSTLTTASNSSVLIINGGNPCNVYWQVGSSATIGTGTAFMGSILARTSITLTTGATLEGRALAHDGAVTLDSNKVSAAGCSGVADAGAGGGVADAGAGGGVADAGAGGGVADAGAGGGVADAGAGGVVADAGAGGVVADAGAGGGVADAGGGQDGGSMCEGHCVDLNTDHDNCGSCGNVCGQTEKCLEGSCCHL
jgi:hypothetical protein